MSIRRTEALAKIDEMERLNDREKQRGGRGKEKDREGQR